MRYIKDPLVYTYEVQKSIFIGLIYPIESLLDLETLLKEAKLKYPKANHYTYAYVFGSSGEQQGASDDGEPSRTAGIPMLEVIKHHELTNVLVIVIRFFGGIKLGSGGLVRAYTKTVADGLKDSTFYTKKMVDSYEITFPYALTHIIDSMDLIKIKILHKSFLEHVTYHILIIEGDLSLFDEIKHQFISIKKLAPEVLYIDL